MQIGNFSLYIHSPQPNCAGKHYSGGFYSNGAEQIDFRRRRRSIDARHQRSANSTGSRAVEEDVVAVLTVRSSGKTTKLQSTNFLKT